MPYIYINPVGGGGTNPPEPSGASGNFFDQFDAAHGVAAPASPYAGAIASVESGGDYGQLGPVTKSGDRAYGKYQIMGNNIPQWSQEVLGKSITPREFLSNKDIQDQIFNAKFGSYVDKYGPEGAAKAWFAGERGMNDPNRRDMLGTTVASYADKFNKATGAPSGNFFDQFDTPSASAAITSAPTTEFSAKGEPSIGMGEAIGRGVAQGATANFYDELRGLVEAGGANPNDPASVYNLVKGAYKYWSGDQEAAKKYEAATARERAATKQAEIQRPYSSLAGGLLGAIAVPIGGAATGATLGTRIGRGATAGGLFGGLSGVGAGEDTAQRLVGGALGTATGTVVGAAAPPLVEGAVRGVGGLINAPANLLRTAINPSAEAARRVAVQTQRGMQADPILATRLSAQQFASTPEAMLADIGGAPVRALARATADISPEARQVMETAAANRFQTATQRLSDWLQGAFHYPNVQALQAAIDKAQEIVNPRLYGKAIAAGRGGIWDKDLAEITQSPAVQMAVKNATAQAQNLSAGSMGTTTLQRWVNNGKPTLEFWDLVKRALDRQIARPQREEDIMALTAVKNAIVKKLDAAVPSYAQARAGAAAFFGAENALEAGQKFVMAPFANAGARQAIAKMSTDERKLFEDGFISRYVEILNRTGDRRSVINKIANTPEAREKLEIALGPQKAKELEARVRIEGIMNIFHEAVSGNSKTARYLLDAGLAYGVGTGGDVFNPSPVKMLNSALAFGALRGKRAINENVAREVAKLLTSNDPKLLSRGIAIVVRNQNLFNSLRAADAAISRATAREAVPTSIANTIAQTGQQQ